jgi:hypothetical protein
VAKVRAAVDLVAVAPAFFRPNEIAPRDEVGDDLLRCTLADADLVGELADPNLRIARDTEVIANIGPAVVIVPIMRRRYGDLSIGYVTARLVESTFILVGIVAVLGVITLRREVAGGSEGTVAYALAAIKDWTFLLGPGWVVGWGNGLILGYMMYRSQLVPRPWPWLGMIGGPLLFIAGTIVLFRGNPAANGLKGPATIPEAAWELFLGIYCTIWGFRKQAPILSEGDEPETSAPAAALSPA